MSNVNRSAFTVIAMAIAVLTASCAIARDQPITQPSANIPMDRNNSGSQRWEVHQTYGGVVYNKDPNIWVYSRQFAEYFGMPMAGVAELGDAEAIAFRMIGPIGQQCGLGGNSNACSAVYSCQMDMYFDEDRVQLPWATQEKHRWLPSGRSSLYLRSKAPPPSRAGDMADPLPDPKLKLDGPMKWIFNGLLPFSDSSGLPIRFFSNEDDDKDPNSQSPKQIVGYSRAFETSFTQIGIGFGCGKKSRDDIAYRLIKTERLNSPALQKYAEIKLPAAYVRQIMAVQDKAIKEQSEFNRRLIDSIVK